MSPGPGPVAAGRHGHRLGEGVVNTEWTDRKVNRYGESWDQLTIAVGTAVRRYSTEAPPLTPVPSSPCGHERRPAPTTPGIASALAALRQPFVPGDQHTFLSELTVGELVLLEEIGFRPVDIVSGAGTATWNPQFTTAGNEGTMWGRAIASAIDNARAGILEELRSRRADGVVAMRFELEREQASLITCTMLGTAVQGPVGARSPAHPFATTLSARDFHLLLRAGYRPVGIVIGARWSASPPVRPPSRSAWPVTTWS